MRLDIKPTIFPNIETVLQTHGTTYWKRDEDKEIELSVNNLRNGGLCYVKTTSFFVSLCLTAQALTVAMLNEAITDLTNIFPQMFYVGDAFYSDDILMFGEAVISETSDLQMEVDRKLELLARNSSAQAESTLRLENLYNLYFYPNTEVAQAAFCEDKNRMGIDVSELAGYGIQLDLRGVPPSIIPERGEPKGLRLVKGY